jgi:hypothetical protein
MPILGIIASAITGNLVTTSYESIETVTVGGGGSATVSFTSIPATYTHLQIRSIQRATAGAGNGEDQNALIFNGDTSSNYSRHNIYGTGSVTGANGTASDIQISIADSPRNGATANAFGVGIIDILDYANTNKYKTIKSLDGCDLNGAGVIIFGSGSWRNTAAITSITITAYNTAFAQYSQFALYGIKGA